MKSSMDQGAPGLGLGGLGDRRRQVLGCDAV